MKLSDSIPVFRMFDVDKAKEFYCEFLGGKVDWEHQFEPNTPVYMQVSIDQVTLHLSEHHGDAAPGSTLRILCDDLDGYNTELLAKRYKFARPGIIDQDWACAKCASLIRLVMLSFSQLPSLLTPDS